MGWASKVNNNPDKDKEKPIKKSKRQIERELQQAVNLAMLKTLASTTD